MRCPARIAGVCDGALEAMAAPEAVDAPEGAGAHGLAATRGLAAIHHAAAAHWGGGRSARGKKPPGPTAGHLEGPHLSRATIGEHTRARQMPEPLHARRAAPPSASPERTPHYYAHVFVPALWHNCQAIQASS